MDIGHNPEGVKRRIGYMSQRFSLYDDLTVEENIRFFGGVYGLSTGSSARRRQETVRLAGLQGRERTPDARAFRRLEAAPGPGVRHAPSPRASSSSTSRPAAPTPSPDGSSGTSSTTLRRRGTTVLVTTHYLDEAEYCNDLVLMHGGRIVAQGSPGELKREVISGAVYEVECADPVGGHGGASTTCPWCAETAIFGTRLHVSLERDEDLDPRPGALAGRRAARVALRRGSSRRWRTCSSA